MTKYIRLNLCKTEKSISSDTSYIFHVLEKDLIESITNVVQSKFENISI
ncbi:MAG: hypothetical protein IJP61_13960 [Treponema sp.]|nr:hypothetical protein [Treponema sp.]